MGGTLNCFHAMHTMYRRYSGKSFSILKHNYDFFHWTEVLKHIQYHLFPDGMLVNSMTALTKNEFTVTGELMAASVVQGGPSPCFLSKEAFGYVVDGIDSVSTEDWIPKVCNEKLKGAIEEVRLISHYVNYAIKKSPFHPAGAISIYLNYFIALLYYVFLGEEL